MWYITKPGTAQMEYFSFDKRFVGAEGNWTPDKKLALAFGDERSAGDFQRRLVSYAHTAKVIRG